MTQRVLSTHRELSSGQHAIASPDIKGFCVVGAPHPHTRLVASGAVEPPRVEANP